MFLRLQPCSRLAGSESSVVKVSSLSLYRYLLTSLLLWIAIPAMPSSFEADVELDEPGADFRRVVGSQGS